MWQDFEISQDADGAWHAVNGFLSVTVLPDGKARLFHRREIRPFAKPPRKDSALVAELDGVRVFIYETHIVVTKQNLSLG